MTGSLSSLCVALALVAKLIAPDSTEATDDPQGACLQRAQELASMPPIETSERRHVPCAEVTDDDEERVGIGDLPVVSRIAPPFRWTSSARQRRRLRPRLDILSMAPKTSPPRP